MFRAALFTAILMLGISGFLSAQLNVLAHYELAYAHLEGTNDFIRQLNTTYEGDDDMPEIKFLNGIGITLAQQFELVELQLGVSRRFMRRSRSNMILSEKVMGVSEAVIGDYSLTYAINTIKAGIQFYSRSFGLGGALNYNTISLKSTLNDSDNDFQEKNATNVWSIRIWPSVIVRNHDVLHFEFRPWFEWISDYALSTEGLIQGASTDLQLTEIQETKPWLLGLSIIIRNGPRN